MNAKVIVAMSNSSTPVLVLEEGSAYQVTGNQKIQFIKRVDGELVTEGTTNEELISVLIHRLKFLNGMFPCRENDMAIAKLEEALLWLNERTAKRISQGVVTTNVAHLDISTVVADSN